MGIAIGTLNTGKASCGISLGTSTSASPIREDQELTKAAGSADVKRFDDNASTLAAYSAGKVQFVAAGVSVVAATISKDSELDAESKSC